jgi:hypothetical protein
MSATDLLARLILHCRSALPEGTVILQPGDSLQHSPASAWAEFWIDRISTSISRRSSPRETEFSLTINCFARPPQSTSAATQLANALSDCLRQSDVPLNVQEPSCGTLRLREPELRDVSRPATAKTAGLWHWIVSVKGTAPSE